MLHRSPPPTSASGPEQSIGHLADFPLGTKKEIKVGDVTALVVSTPKGLFAVGHKCTHYGAPLEKGVLDGCRLKCPWHGAVFNVDGGDVEEAPAIDALPSYPVRLTPQGEVFITVPQTDDNKRSTRKHIIPQTALVNPSPPFRTFAIVGAGASAMAAADTLRQAGFQGRVVLLTREDVPPYDRTKLSKDPPSGEKVEGIYLRNQAELAEMKVEVLYSHTVTGVDVKAKTLTLQSHPPLHYDELLIACGSVARHLSVPGSNLPNIFTIRTPPDGAALSQTLTSLGGADVVVVGTGFIGLEVAVWLSSKKDLAKSVTVIGHDATPLKSQLGEQVGRGLQKKHEAAGVVFQLKSDVESFTADAQGRVSGVKLKSGVTVPAQVVIVAVGAQLQTDWLKGSGVELTDKGELVVDKYYRHASGVYAAGDIARFPYFAQSDALIRVEHWALAQQSGRAAALGMLYGRSMPPVEYVPYFWTVQVDKKSVRYCGYGGGYDEVVVDGDTDDLKFVALYCKGESILAVASCQRDPFVSQAAELIQMRKMPSKSEIKKAKFQLESFF